MATLTVESIVEAGLTPTLVGAAGGGDQFKNDSAEDTFLFIRNASGGALTVTVTAQNISKGVAGFGTMTRTDLVVVVGAGADSLIGPIASAFNDATSFVQVTYSGVGSLTVGAIKLPAAP